MITQERIEELEGKAFDAQYQMVKLECGQEAADNANYGWGISEDETSSSICSKIYGHGLITTDVNFETGEITHDLDI